MAADPDALVVVARAPRPWRLARRSPTLGGNVPLRAAQACTPFLLGNAFGWQLSPPEPLRVARSWRGVEVHPRPLRAVTRGPNAVEITVDTGLSLVPPPGAVPVVERAHNRRDRRVAVAETELPRGGDLVLTLRVALSRAEGEATLAGELASVALFPADLAVALRPLADAPDVGRAHLAFFDAEYFDHKQSSPTRRYRARAAQRRADPAGASPPAGVEVVYAGGAAPALARSPAGVLSLALPVEVAVAMAFHGQRVEVHADAAALARRARDVERVWRDALGDAAAPDVGAVRYFTTYVTTHTAGDPHLFFKPATLLRATPGLGAVIDGPATDAWEVLRGVTDAAWFHALPAVVQLDAPAARARPGEPLVRVRPAALREWALQSPATT